MELGKKIRERLSSRESKVAAEQKLEEASDLADAAAARQAPPRRGLFEPEAPEIPAEIPSRHRPPSSTRPCPRLSRSPPPGPGG